MISRPLFRAKAARLLFQVQRRGSLEPPESALIRSLPAFGWSARPRCCHQRRMDSTANSAVSWSVPTLPHPLLLAMS